MAARMANFGLSAVIATLAIKNEIFTVPSIQKNMELAHIAHDDMMRAQAKQLFNQFQEELAKQAEKNESVLSKKISFYSTRVLNKISQNMSMITNGGWISLILLFLAMLCFGMSVYILYRNGSSHFERLRARLDELGEHKGDDFNDVRKNIRKNREALHHLFRTKKKAITTILKNKRATRPSRAAKLLRQLRTELRRVVDKQAEDQDQFQNIVSAIERFQKSKKDFESASTNIISVMQKIEEMEKVINTKAKIEASFEESIAKISDGKADIENFLAKFARNFKDKVSEMQSNFDDKFSKMESNFNEKVSKVESNSNEMVSKLGNGFKGEIRTRLTSAQETNATSLQTMKQTFEDSLNEVKIEIGQMEQNVSNLMSGQLQSFRVTQLELETQLETQLATQFETQLKTQMESSQAFTQQKSEDLAKTLQGSVDASLQSLLSAGETMGKTIKEQLDGALQSQSSVLETRIKENVDMKVNSIFADMQNKFADVNRQQIQLGEMFERLSLQETIAQPLGLDDTAALPEASSIPGIVPSPEVTLSEETTLQPPRDGHPELVSKPETVAEDSAVAKSEGVPTQDNDAQPEQLSESTGAPKELELQPSHEQPADTAVATASSFGETAAQEERMTVVHAEVPTESDPLPSESSSQIPKPEPSGRSRSRRRPRRALQDPFSIKLGGHTVTRADSTTTGDDVHQAQEQPRQEQEVNPAVRPEPPTEQVDPKALSSAPAESDEMSRQSRRLSPTGEAPKIPGSSAVASPLQEWAEQSDYKDVAVEEGVGLSKFSNAPFKPERGGGDGRGQGGERGRGGQKGQGGEKGEGSGKGRGGRKGRGGKNPEKKEDTEKKEETGKKEEGPTGGTQKEGSGGQRGGSGLHKGTQHSKYAS